MSLFFFKCLSLLAFLSIGLSAEELTVYIKSQYTDVSVVPVTLQDKSTAEYTVRDLRDKYIENQKVKTFLQKLKLDRRNVIFLSNGEILGDERNLLHPYKTEKNKNLNIGSQGAVNVIFHLFRYDEMKVQLIQAREKIEKATLTKNISFILPEAGMQITKKINEGQDHQQFFELDKFHHIKDREAYEKFLKETTDSFHFLASSATENIFYTKKNNILNSLNELINSIQDPDNPDIFKNIYKSIIKIERDFSGFIVEDSSSLKEALEPVINLAKDEIRFLN